MIDKSVAVGRAAVGLIITILIRYLNILSVDIDIVIIFLCCYTLLSLFIYSRIINLIWASLDVAVITAICYYTNNIFLPLFIILISFITYRYQFSISGAFSVGITLLSFYILKVDSIIFYLSLFSVLFIQTKIMDEIIKNKLKKGLIKYGEEINSLKEEKEKLIKKAKDETIYDKLTNLHNLKYFSLRVKEEIAKAKRYNFKFSIGVVGIDNFTHYYNTYGKRAADEALKIVGILLLAYVRNSDLVARYDDTDKFLVIFPYTDAVSSKIPISRFIDAVTRYRFDDVNPDVKLSMSAGIACFPDDAQEYDKLLEIAINKLKSATLLKK